MLSWQFDEPALEAQSTCHVLTRTRLIVGGHQLAVSSPVTLRMLAQGAVAALGVGRPFEKARDLLEHEYGGRVELVDSGTSALAVALRRSVATTGAAVALPAYACYDLATAALAAGVSVQWYDVVPDTLQPDAASLARCIDGGVGAVVFVHLFGAPVDIAAWAPMLQRARHPVVVIDDAAQASGASVRGQPCGTLGTYGILSFGRGKGRTAGGGGALVVREEVAADPAARRFDRPRAGAWRVCLAAAQFCLGRPSLYWIPHAIPGLNLGETVFRQPAPLTPLTRASAGMLLAGRNDVRPEVAVRQRNASRLLGSVPPSWRVVVAADRAVAGWLRMPVLAPTTAVREFLVEHGRRLGVVRGYPKTLPSLGVLDGPTPPVPGAQTLVDRLCTVPTHSVLKESDLVRLERLLADASALARHEARSDQ